MQAVTVAFLLNGLHEFVVEGGLRRQTWLWWVLRKEMMAVRRG